MSLPHKPILIDKPKDPDAVKDYKLDWAPFLDGDTISSSVWIMPTGITKDSDSHDTDSVTIWLSGGTESTVYELVNRITTGGGRTEDQTVRVPVAQC